MRNKASFDSKEIEAPRSATNSTDDDMLGNYCEEIEKFREYQQRHIVANPNVGYLSREEESFYEMIELAIKEELESSTYYLMDGEYTV